MTGGINRVSHAKCIRIPFDRLLELTQTYFPVEKLFKGGWVHTDKTARIQGIYLATPEPTTNHFRPESFIGRMKDHFNRWSDYAYGFSSR
jgi:hypothetical protein